MRNFKGHVLNQEKKIKNLELFYGIITMNKNIHVCIYGRDKKVELFKSLYTQCGLLSQ